MTDFFISYNKADKGWAEWIAWQLDAAGYTTVLQAWDFVAGVNFVNSMQQAIADSERTVIVLSPDYLTSQFTQPEWAAAFARDPTGQQGILLPIRVRECDLTGLLGQIVSIDFVGLDAENAKNLLLAQAKRSRLKPLLMPVFPGFAQPTFPGVSVRDYSLLTFKQALGGTNDELFSIAFSPDGKYVVAGSNGAILLWDRNKPTRPKKIKGDYSYVYSVAISKNSRYMAAGGEDCFVRVWDLHTGQQKWEAAHHEEAVYSVAFSPDSLTLASGGYDRKVRLWNAESGQLLRSSDRALDGLGRVTSVVFSPDATLLAIGSLDDTVRLWNLKSRKVQVLRRHKSSVENVAFSPDGKFLASCGLDKTVQIWNVAEGRQQWSALEHEYLVRSVAFSPDGGTLASASWDKTVKLWDVETGELKKTLPFNKSLPWHTDWIWSVAFSPEGMFLASSGSDGQVILWLVDEVT